MSALYPVIGANKAAWMGSSPPVWVVKIDS
jgi:hypothetical protein